MEQRKALGDMLQQLMKQRDQREQELRQILVSTHSMVVVLVECVSRVHILRFHTTLAEHIFFFKN